MSDNIKTFTFPTTIIFGQGAIRELPHCLEELAMRKPLLLTDEGLDQTTVPETVRDVLRDWGAPHTYFAGIGPNPHIEDVDRAAEFFKSNHCDGIIALGGGSPIDAAKAVAVLAALGGPLTKFDGQTDGSLSITPPLPPIIAVPTTAGTGSEVGRCAVITSDESPPRKFMVCSPHLLPARALLDPELTVGLPPLTTAATGMDAFTHHIEALVVNDYHPMCDAIALKGIEMVTEYLARAVKTPSDIEARANMLMAATMGAVAFQKDLGAAHSMAHPLSAECGLHHGLANAICLPHVMRFNLDYAASKYAKAAYCMGIDISKLDESEAAQKAVEAVIALNDKIGIPGNLKQAGVTEEALPSLAHNAFLDGCHKTNPRPCTEQDLLGLFKAAF